MRATSSMGASPVDSAQGRGGELSTCWQTRPCGLVCRQPCGHTA